MIESRDDTHANTRDALFLRYGLKAFNLFFPYRKRHLPRKLKIYIRSSCTTSRADTERSEVVPDGPARHGSNAGKHSIEGQRGVISVKTHCRTGGWESTGREPILRDRTGPRYLAVHELRRTILPYYSNISSTTYFTYCSYYPYTTFCGIYLNLLFSIPCTYVKPPPSARPH